MEEKQFFNISENESISVSFCINTLMHPLVLFIYFHEFTFIHLQLIQSRRHEQDGFVREGRALKAEERC